MDLGLAERRAVVIGGTRGIGRAVVDVFAAEGCRVVTCARQSAHVPSATQVDIVDAADPEALVSFIERSAALMGGLDVLVYNASGSLGRGNDEESWRAGIDVDLLGAVRACEAALPHLERSDAGSIVIIGSVSALEAVSPRRAYNSVKAAVLPYAKSIAQTAGPAGVRCNVVSPGAIFFPGGVWDLVRTAAPDRYADAVAKTPLGRLGVPGDVAAAVAFLASPRAGFISGTNLLCDGARTEGVQY